MTNDFRLLMIGAMYENGGNTTHRHLDGHPELFVYPFESQLGTRLVNDALASMFPVKYRWPAFALDASPYEDYKAIIDEECKVRARTPHVSKFRDYPFDFSDDERLDRYQAHVARRDRSRGGNVAAFFRATFEAWNDFRRSGDERVYVGYSPILSVDGDKVLDDLPAAHFLHIVRNPWSAYADTKKRPVPLSLPAYMLGWSLNQWYALMLRERYPDRFYVLRIEDVISDPEGVLGELVTKLRLSSAESLAKPSWNGRTLEEVYPWGTIRQPTPTANRETAEKLSGEEREEIRLHAGPYLEAFGYESFLS